MAAYFFDSSAIVKRYVKEIGSAWVTSLLHPRARNSTHLARIAGVEVIAAFARRHRGGSLSLVDLTQALAQFQVEFTHDLTVVPVTPRVIGSAMDLARKHALRGYDAVHLAAALAVEARRRARRASGLTLVSADAELNSAAAAEGLAVENPGAHP